MTASSPPDGARGPGADEPAADGPDAVVPPAIVVHGAATPEQVAALVAVLSAASGDDAPAGADTASTWAARSAAMRPPIHHGPGAWRTSLRA